VRSSASELLGQHARVRDHEERGVELGRHEPESLGYQRDAVHVHPAVWLVEQSHLGAQQRCQEDLCSLPLPTAEPPEGIPAHEVLQLEELHQLAQVLRGPEPLGDQRGQLLQGDPCELRRDLVGERDTHSRPLSGRQAGHVHTPEQHPTPNNPDPGQPRDR